MILTHLTTEHYPAVDVIYLEGIATCNATFQTEGKTWDEWNAGHLQPTSVQQGQNVVE